MWNEPNEERLSKVPGLYETEKVPLQDKLIHLHFFIGGCDWYVAEYDHEKRLFWGFAILNFDYQNAEWGYFSFDELREVNVSGVEVDCELEKFWRVRKACEIENICKANDWPEPSLAAA